MLSVKAEQPRTKTKPTTMNVQSNDDAEVDDDGDNMAVGVGFRGLDVVLVVFVSTVVKSNFFWGMWMDPRGRRRRKLWCTSVEN